jgi:putative membrane protein
MYMKNLIYLMAISASVLTFQACSGGNKDAKESADSLNMVKDTTTNVAATGGIAVDEADAKFTTQAAVGGMAEVELGKLALEKSSNAKVKEFATMMVKDHGMANTELMAIAKLKNITLPSTVDDEHKQKMDDLSKKTGADFDKAYVDAMVSGHKSTLKLMEDESKDGKDADLKSFASKTAPIVQGHLVMINKINDGMK